MQIIKCELLKQNFMFERASSMMIYLGTNIKWDVV
jgi:hypothetical protein